MYKPALRQSLLIILCSNVVKIPPYPTYNKTQTTMNQQHITPTPPAKTKVVNPQIAFSYNWNHKLDNDCYTTFRLHNPERNVAGVAFDVFLNKKYIHSSVIVEVKKLRLSDINNWHAYLDANMDAEKFTQMLRKMYAPKFGANIDKIFFDWILFQRLSE